MVFSFFNKKYKIRPISAIIDISNSCNARCPFCARQISDKKINEIMSKEIFYNIMEQISEIKSIKTISLAAWGEAMLHPDFDEFVNYIHKKGYKIFLATNMSLAHKHFDTLINVDQIMYSIEGFDKDSYNNLRKNLDFEQVYKNISDFNDIVQKLRKDKKASPQRSINCLLTKETNLESFFDLWGNLADEFRVAPMLPIIVWDNNNKAFKLKSNKNILNNLFSLNRKVKNMYCAMPFNTITIRSNGQLALCCSDYDSEIDLGNYKNIKKDFWENKNLQKIRQEFKDKNLNICKNCMEFIGVEKKQLLSSYSFLKKNKNYKIRLYENR